MINTPSLWNEQARAWVDASRPTALTDTERALLADARAAGYLTASGRRVALYVAWQRLCREAGRPCITIRVFKTYATVAIDSVEAWRGPVGEAQRQAQRIAASSPPQFRPREPNLWTTTLLDRPLPSDENLGGDGGVRSSLSRLRPVRAATVQKTRMAPVYGDTHE